MARRYSSKASRVPLSAATSWLLWYVLLGIVVLWGLTWLLTYGPLPTEHSRVRGPLDPGVVVRDHGSGRSKCYDCEGQAGEAGGKPKCLTCTAPSFKYLDDTIIAARGAAENGACMGCRAAP